MTLVEPGMRVNSGGSNPAKHSTIEAHDRVVG